MSDNFKKLVLAGYQGWFGKPANKIIKCWSHWSKSGDPQPGDYTAFEISPEFSEYRFVDLHQTGYANLYKQGQISIRAADMLNSQEFFQKFMRNLMLKDDKGGFKKNEYSFR
jgi:hypothetical protein